MSAPEPEIMAHPARLKAVLAVLFAASALVSLV